MKKSLLNLGEKELSDILSNFRKIPRIFHSEAQFQFELAWKLQEEFDCVAKLEELVK